MAGIPGKQEVGMARGCLGINNISGHVCRPGFLRTNEKKKSNRQLGGLGGVWVGGLKCRAHV